MPYFGLGSPNAPTMRVHADDSSTAAVADYDEVVHNNEKKRSAAAEDYDETPAVCYLAKKIKADTGEEDSQSDLIATKPALPVIALNMTQDKNYAKFVESYEEANINTAQRHYYSFWKNTAKGALAEIKKKFSPVDSKGHPIDDKAAEKKLQQCFYGRYLTKKKKIEAATGKEDSPACLSLPADSRSVEETPSQKSSRAKSSTRSQPQEERPNDKTPTKLQFTELERLEILRYYGRSIISDYFLHKDVKDCDKKVDDCEWYFKPKKSDTEWVAVKKGFNEKDAAEGLNKFTGVLNIANWLYRNGVFERYADTPWGENFLDRKGLCLQSLGKIFDEERVQQNTGRAVSPSSSPAASVSEMRKVKFDLQGDERREWTRFFNDISQKLSAARESDDPSRKEFYGMLMNCMQKNMINTQKWNDERRCILEMYMKDYEEAERMKIVGVNDTFMNDEYLPSLITEAKEKLCA